MKDRSLLPRLSIVLMLSVVLAGVFQYAERLYLRDVPLKQISMLAMGALAILALVPLLLRGLLAIANTRTGRYLRAATAVTFCLSLATAILVGPLAPLLPAAASASVLPAGKLPVLMTSAMIALLTAPIGWRVIAGYVSGRSTDAMPFFKASPIALGVTFALALVFLALGPAFIEALMSMELPIESAITIGVLTLAPAVLLFCVATAAPLIFLLRLMQIGGSWIRQHGDGNETTSPSKP